MMAMCRATATTFHGAGPHSGWTPHRVSPCTALHQRVTAVADVQGEQYPRLARQWKIWPFPRGHHRNVVYLPYKGSVWLLADARFCPLLLPELRLLPPDSLQKLPGAQGGSCTDTCM